jgi:hypothetical protein
MNLKHWTETFKNTEDITCCFNGYSDLLRLFRVQEQIWPMDYNKKMIRTMLKISHFFLTLIFFLFLGFSASPQGIKVEGIVKDEITLKPIRNVNIIIKGTSEGVFSGEDGRYSLTLKKIPASLTLSCIGYTTVYYDIRKAPAKPLELVLRQSAFTLQEVDISAKRFSFVFKDKNYSILDYEITEDNLLLLIFRYQLKRSELILLTLAGDTVTIVSVPELNPKCLYKDFLDNVYYISTKENAFQCYYNDSLKQLGFIYRTTFDSLIRMVRPFLFTSGDRFYFQEFTLDGFGTNIGYYDTHHHKEYIRNFSGESTRKNYYDDLKFYSQWNSHLDQTSAQLSGYNPIGNSPAKEGQMQLKLPKIDEFDLEANNHFNYRRINAPLVKLGENNMAVFNFTEDKIELMDQEGKVYRSVPISFHKEEDGNPLASLLSAIIPVAEWKWRGKIHIDEYYRNAYTTFGKNGMVQIRKIDLETGKLTSVYDLPFPFPKKINVYKGDAYFLVKDVGAEFEKWKLVKVKL